jgi:sulfite reductase alpha subunit-like flavoprotein
VAVTTYRTPYGRNRQGLCSGFLGDVSIGEEIWFTITPSPLNSLRAIINENLSSSTPPSSLLLIGPGTGIAPMRALLQDHLLFHSNSAINITTSASPISSSQKQQQIILLYGCRRPDQDDLYREEWQAIQTYHQNPYLQTIESTDNTLPSISTTADNTHPTTITTPPLHISVAIHTAYSQRIGQLQKEYVTHLIQSPELAPQLCQLLLENENSKICIAGSAKRMPKDVKNSLQIIFEKYGQLSTNEAQEFLAYLIRRKRLFIEAWG